MQELRKIIAKERDEIIQKNKVINVVIGVFNDFNTKIKTDRTSQENENEDMITEIRDFALKIKSYLINKDKEIEFPNFPKAIEGTSVKAKYGFRFMIDQPEDDISMKRIENYMIDYFNSVRDKKQVIFVTHNPLLVVNLDVDNVIDITKDRKNILNIKAGCLEDEDLLEVVSENLDGGKEAVERRLKIYGTN